eukprot:3204897-Amphidinium_carterae.1
MTSSTEAACEITLALMTLLEYDCGSSDRQEKYRISMTMKRESYNHDNGITKCTMRKDKEYSLYISHLTAVL